jgi:hypothetical protein
VGNSNLYLSLISAAGMILVAVAAVAIWRQKTTLSYRCFFLGELLSGWFSSSSVHWFWLAFRFFLGANPNLVGQTSNKFLNHGR